AGLVRAAGPDLLAVDPPAAVDSDRPGPDAGRVGPGAWLAEQLAPDDVLAQRGRNPALDLVGASVLDEGEDVPAGDAVARPLDAGLGELLLDHQLLKGARVATPRTRPVRHHVATLDQRFPAARAVEGREPLHVGPDRRPERLGLGGQVNRDRPPDAVADKLGDLDRRLLDIDDRGD